MLLSEVQKMGGVAAIVDAEHALDPIYAQALGVNIDELLRLPARYWRNGP